MLDEHWKVSVALTQRPGGVVSAMATVLPYKKLGRGNGVMSPCGSTRRADYVKGPDGWRELPPPGSKPAQAPAPAPPAKR
jgi:hypothetical protein